MSTSIIYLQYMTWNISPMHICIPCISVLFHKRTLFVQRRLACNRSLFLAKTFLWFVTLVLRAKLGPQLSQIVSSPCVNIHFKWYVVSTEIDITTNKLGLVQALMNMKFQTYSSQSSEERRGTRDGYFNAHWDLCVFGCLCNLFIFYYSPRDL